MWKIFKQSSFLMIAQILTRIIGFFYTIFLANKLGVDNFGLYSIGLAYFSVFASISDFGFNRFLVREITKSTEKTGEIICSVLMLRLSLVCVFFAIFALFLSTFDQDKLRVSIILLSVLAVLPQAIAITFDGIFIALQKLQFSAISAFVSSLSTVVIGLYLVSENFGPLGAISAVIFGQIIYMVTLLFFVYWQHRIRLSSVTTGVLKEALLGSLPYGILAMLGLLYFRIDTIMLSYMKGNFDTGLYAAGYKFLDALIFLPNAVSFALFPEFTKLHQENPLKIKSMFLKSSFVMFGLGFLITVAYFLILPVIVRTFLPQYLQSIEIIQILSLAIPFIFVHVSAATVLTSTDKYLKQVILFSLIPISANILLNLIFIPQFGYLAAAWITVVSDLVSAVVIIYCIKKYILK